MKDIFTFMKSRRNLKQPSQFANIDLNKNFELRFEILPVEKTFGEEIQLLYIKSNGHRNQSNFIGMKASDGLKSDRLENSGDSWRIQMSGIFEGTLEPRPKRWNKIQAQQRRIGNTYIRKVYHNDKLRVHF